ncbi:hypothetical protein KEJ37_06915 [Candidatus Bathyarchaeota archaeon]|nr:hypothetical protein [Candidatus Bathyarchaeota archaeon]
MSLKDEAFEFWQKGLAVVPFELTWDAEKGEWKKKPICEWGKWQVTPQTLEEFEAFNWDKIEAFGVLLGRTKDGLYLCCVDIDRANFDLNLLPATRLEKTLSGFYHAFYLSKRPVQGIKRHDLGLELLGGNNLVVVWPSKGYERLNDVEPAVVEDATALFFELIAKMGGELKPEWKNKFKARA